MTSEKIRTFKIGDVVRTKSYESLIGIIIEDEVDFTVFILAAKSQYFKTGDITYWKPQELSHSLVQQL